MPHHLDKASFTTTLYHLSSPPPTEPYPTIVVYMAKMPHTWSGMCGPEGCACICRPVGEIARTSMRWSGLFHHHAGTAAVLTASSAHNTDKGVLVGTSGSEYAAILSLKRFMGCCGKHTFMERGCRTLWAPTPWQHRCPCSNLRTLRGKTELYRIWYHMISSLPEAMEAENPGCISV